VLRMEDFELIRRMVLVDGLSQRDVALKLNKSLNSNCKVLINCKPANYALKVPEVCPVTDPVSLYDLNSDIGEAKNLAVDQSECVAAMQADYQRWDAGNMEPRCKDDPAPPAAAVRGNRYATVKFWATEIRVECTGSDPCR